MRLVRLIAVFLGMALVVAVVGGTLVRSAELERNRDLRVEKFAEMVVLDLEGQIATVDTAAELSSDPGRTAEALATADGSRVVCAIAITGGDAVCAGPATAPDLAPRLDQVPFTEVVDGTLVVARRGPDIAVVSALTIDRLLGSSRISTAGRGDLIVEVVSGDGSGDGAARTVGDRRVASRPIAAAPELTLVASLPAEVALDPAERTLSLTLLVLAVLLLVLAGFTLVAERKSLLERASLDPLTKLPNRGELERRGEALVQTAVRCGEGVCLMLVDLNGFKAINDTHGHHAGDEILKLVGTRLRNAVRSYDLVARWGGDEFVLMLQGIDNEAFATSRAGVLADLVSEPLRVDDADGLGLQVGASVGIALLGSHGSTLGELVESADAAMYAAKRAGDQFRMAEPAEERAAYAGQGVALTE